MRNNDPVLRAVTISIGGLLAVGVLLQAESLSVTQSAADNVVLDDGRDKRGRWATEVPLSDVRAGIRSHSRHTEHRANPPARGTMNGSSS